MPIKENPDLYYYNNPEAFQLDIIKAMDDHFNKDDNNEFVLDPNTTVGFLIDGFSNISASLIKGIEDKLNSQYPKRAQNITDLYNNISDYDYVSFQANPANYKINIKIAKKILLSSAVDYNEFYNLLVIPKTTEFLIGNIPFSLYYDIFIKINKTTNNIIVNYNTDSSNPLNQLSNYNIPYSEFTYMGIDYISFEIVVYQFKRTSITESIDNTIGFYKTYNIDDKFYAIRAFDKVNNFEFNYSYSNTIYDPLKPTIVIKSIPDENKIELFIPQIYFTNNLISSTIYVIIYTTRGKIDINIDTSDTNLISANFTNVNIESETFIPYITPLKHIESLLVIPLNNKIVGGKDPDTFETVKNNLIYNLNTNRVLISETDITNYFETYGFKVINKLDNFKERIYYIMNFINISDDTSIQNRLSINNNKLILNINELDTYMDSIKKIEDNKYVILPNAIYKCDKNRNLSYLLKSSDITYLNSLSKDDAMVIYNNEDYNFYPYHLLIDTKPANPFCYSYDLLNCNVDHLLFTGEHPYIDYQIYVNDISIVHLNDGCGGYKIYFGIEKNKALKEIQEENILLYLSIVTSSKKLIGKSLTYESSVDNLDIYSCVLDTDYNINDDNIKLQNIDYQPGYTGGIFVPLSTTANLVFYIKSDEIDTSAASYQDYDIFHADLMRNLLTNLQNNFYDDTWIAVSKFTFDIQFGKRLSDIIDNNLTITYSGEKYATYQSDEIDRYTHDIYERDSNGKLVYSIENNHVNLNIIHHQGDIKYDADGNIIYKHKKGDLIIDSDGNPIISEYRSLICSIDMFNIDYKYKLVNTFDIFNIIKILNSYYDIIREHRTNLYGNTLCYFQPIATKGIGEFYINSDEVETIDLNISLGFKLYCKHTLVDNPTILQTISENIKNDIKTYINNTKNISLANLATDITNNYNEYIYSIDVEGINGDINIQSIIKIHDYLDITIRPILKLEDNNFYIDDAIDLKFIAIDTK